VTKWESCYKVLKSTLGIEFLTVQIYYEQNNKRSPLKNSILCVEEGVSMLQVKLLGKFSIQHDGSIYLILPLKAQELLAFLLLFSDQPHTRELLAAQLWKDTSPTQSKKYLRQTLWHLQSILDQSGKTEEPLLNVENGWVQINPNAAMHVDVWEMSLIFNQLRDSTSKGLTSEQAESLSKSISLYQGELLIGWYQDWCILERERYRAMVMAQLDKLMVYCLAHQQIESGISYGMHVLQIDHTREKTHRQLMRLYYFSGDRTGALRQFQYCKNILAQELGVQPTQKTRHLYQQILNDKIQHAATSEPVHNGTFFQNNFADETEPRLLTALKQIVADMTSLRNDIELIKQTLEK